LGIDERSGGNQNLVRFSIVELDAVRWCHGKQVPSISNLPRGTPVDVLTGTQRYFQPISNDMLKRLDRFRLFGCITSLSTQTFLVFKHEFSTTFLNSSHSLRHWNPVHERDRFRELPCIGKQDDFLGCIPQESSPIKRFYRRVPLLRWIAASPAR
jgi:hypothetical protein